ncbi:MAG TPA: hypothetical protein VFW04_10385 [Gemmatimonadaceae bacterium]|jgi:hypothetical protein|nr:hypothetical protein [Gemmatimonadaceae bacterium]
MRVSRPVQIVTVFTFVMLAACASGRGARNQPDPGYSGVNVQWDSGPLDRAYNHERADMVTRHNQENEYPRSGESSDQRAERQSFESQDLENRYARGKAAHSQTLPPSDGQHHTDHSDHDHR